MNETCTMHLGRMETKSVLNTLNRRGTETEKIKMDLYKKVLTRSNWLNAVSVASSSISQ
jgi:hypothetical protein